MEGMLEWREQAATMREWLRNRGARTESGPPAAAVRTADVHMEKAQMEKKRLQAKQ